MTQVHISIEDKKTLKISFDVLAREDATDDELELAKSIQDAMIAVIKSLPSVKASLDMNDKGKGHDKIRHQSVNE